MEMRKFFLEKKYGFSGSALFLANNRQSQSIRTLNRRFLH
jgi:hypothetical protein